MDCEHCGNPGCGGDFCQDGTWGFYPENGTEDYYPCEECGDAAYGPNYVPPDGMMLADCPLCGRFQAGLTPEK